MILQTDTVTELRVTTFETKTTAGETLIATVTGGLVSIRYEGATGYATAEFPEGALPALNALIATVLSAVPPVAVTPQTT